MRYFFSLLYIGLCLAACPALAEPAPRTPSFSQCQALASTKTSAQEKAQLTQIFKTNNLFCSMSSAPFTVQHVFGGGQSKSQLRLMMGSNDKYILDGKSLLDVLLPDRASIPPAQMIMLAGQIIGMLGDAFSSNMDASTLSRVGGHVGAYTGILGINARAALQQLAILRAQARLNEEDIEPSFWLTRFSRLSPPLPTQNQNAAAPHVGPAWMQKLMGAGQHLMGTFQGGGSGSE